MSFRYEVRLSGEGGQGLVLAGKVELAPFVEQRPLATINETFEAIGAHAVRDRIVLVPDVGETA